MKTLLTIGMFLFTMSLFAQDTSTTTSSYRVVAQTGKTPVVVNPTYVGGVDAMNLFISENIKYPEVAKTSGQYGKVYVAFKVKEDGTLVDLEVTRGISPELNEEALRIVGSMPKWNSGTRDGQPATIRYYIPVEFKLK
jgi:protein TonB